MPSRPPDGNGLMPPWPLKIPHSAASHRLFLQEKAWSGPLLRRQGDSRIVSATPERMTSTKSRRWTLLACNSPFSPTYVDPVVNPKIPSLVLFSLLLRLRYLFQRMEFAPPCCLLGHPSPFLCGFYHYATSNQGIMNRSHL